MDMEYVWHIGIWLWGVVVLVLEHEAAFRDLVRAVRSTMDNAHPTILDA